MDVININCQKKGAASPGIDILTKYLYAHRTIILATNANSGGF
jgi:hypothetical protein